jgi:hypothetical protein
MTTQSGRGHLLGDRSVVRLRPAMDGGVRLSADVRRTVHVLPARNDRREGLGRGSSLAVFPLSVEGRLAAAHGAECDQYRRGRRVRAQFG